MKVKDFNKLEQLGYKKEGVFKQYHKEVVYNDNLFASIVVFTQKQEGYEPGDIAMYVSNDHSYKDKEAHCDDCCYEYTTYERVEELVPLNEIALLIKEDILEM